MTSEEIRAELVTFRGKRSLELRLYQHDERGVVATAKRFRIPADMLLDVAELILRAQTIVREGVQ